MPEPVGYDWVTQRQFVSEIRRIDERLEHFVKYHMDMMLAESGRINAVMKSEADRINALLVASAQNVSLASARAETTATNLAERVDTSAKALALQVEATTKASTEAVAAAAKALSERIAPLEQMRFEQAGRSGISTPLMMLLSSFAGAVLLYFVQIFMHR